MEIVPVDKLPEKKNTKYEDIIPFLMKFLSMNVKRAKIVVGDKYSSIYSARSVVRKYLKLYKFPIDPVMVNGELYFVRTDMED